jgi:hypothetical protein
MIKNSAFGTENVYSRFIQLSGQVEESWIKTPFRYIEAVDIYDSENEVTGINVLSNEDTNSDSDEALNDLWVTKEES